MLLAILLRLWLVLCFAGEGALYPTTALVPALFPKDPWGGDYRIGVHSADYDKGEVDQVTVTLSVNERAFYLDSNAVVPVSAEKLFAVSMDYANYRQFAPYVLNSKIVDIVSPEKLGAKDQPSADGLVLAANGLEMRELSIWTHMQFVARVLFLSPTVESMHYTRVQAFKNLYNTGDYAIRWALVPKRPEWLQRQETYFSILDGSWYILPIGGGRSYLRYFLKIQVNTLLPQELLTSVIQNSLEPGVRELITAIVNRATKK